MNKKGLRTAAIWLVLIVVIIVIVIFAVYRFGIPDRLRNIFPSFNSSRTLVGETQIFRYSIMADKVQYHDGDDYYDFIEDNKEFRDKLIYKEQLMDSFKNYYYTRDVPVKFDFVDNTNTKIPRTYRTSSGFSVERFASGDKGVAYVLVDYAVDPSDSVPTATQKQVGYGDPPGVKSLDGFTLIIEDPLNQHLININNKKISELSSLGYSLRLESTTPGKSGSLVRKKETYRLIYREAALDITFIVNYQKSMAESEKNNPAFDDLFLIIYAINSPGAPTNKKAYYVLLPDNKLLEQINEERSFQTIGYALNPGTDKIGELIIDIDETPLVDSAVNEHLRNINNKKISELSSLGYSLRLESTRDPDGLTVKEETYRLYKGAEKLEILLLIRYQESTKDDFDLFLIVQALAIKKTISEDTFMEFSSSRIDGPEQEIISKVSEWRDSVFETQMEFVYYDKVENAQKTVSLCVKKIDAYLVVNLAEAATEAGCPVA